MPRALVRIFTAPDAACRPGATWASAAGLIGQRLQRRFQGAVGVEHVEMFSPRSFEFPDVLAAVERGSRLPIVAVDGRIVSEGEKLSESRIVRALEALGLTDHTTARRG